MKRVLELTSKGLYCPAGDFYIDPRSKVEVAVITHAHSDHAGRSNVLNICSEKSLHLLRHRVSKKSEILTKKYGERFDLGGATVSLHPAGHILGSSQVRVQVGKEVWVVSGDYKRDYDPTCDKFEVVKCDTFITEATFAEPRYEWPASNDVIAQMVRWWERNKRDGVVSIVFCYSIGKAQRVIAELGKHGTIHVHPVIEPYIEHYEKSGVKLNAGKLPDKFRGSELIVAPPSANKSEWFYQFHKCESAFVSGWALSRKFNSGFNESFVMSDHADWPALLRTVTETEAKNVYVTHGDSKVLVRHLRSLGLNAAPLDRLASNNIPIISSAQMTLNHFW